MGQHRGGNDAVARGADNGAAMRERKIGVDRPAEDDDAVRRALRGIP